MGDQNNIGKFLKNRFRDLKVPFLRTFRLNCEILYLNRLNYFSTEWQGLLKNENINFYNKVENGKKKFVFFIFYVLFLINIALLDLPGQDYDPLT